MDEAKTEYEGAMNKLVDGKGNLITSVQKLKIMGAKAKNLYLMLFLIEQILV